ncbi:hypothetical protein [Paludisphaera rhizosphaerae]|uniref:hypothetical protein n=1 Tax=Paludisphaera rhizosphaerae TaxID=2711216 RepID=UPI0013EDB2FB|nr:hypothetical protein [Paludisphaera rhizosphaerae]
MPNDRFRPLRLRWDDLRGPGATTGRLRTPALDAQTTAATPRFVGRVVNGGALPTATDRVFLVNPIQLSGAEAEGASATVAVDATRTIPVVVIGSTAPNAGDFLVAFAVAGRWVAMTAGGTPTIACGSCTIPRQDLTLTLSDGATGTYSATMTFNGVDSWTTGCIGEVEYKLQCGSGAPVFSATYHVGGVCPGGTGVACTSPGTGLTLTSQSCSPFIRVYSSAGCPALSAQGIATMTITQ